MTPLEEWNALVAQLLAAGYSQLNAYETAYALRPGLWQAAAAQVVRDTRHVPLHKAAVVKSGVQPPRAVPRLAGRNGRR